MTKERIVYIRRIIGADRTRLPKDLLLEAKRPIGASFNEFGQILKGVTGEEEKKYMPGIIGISASDPSFSKKVEDFWTNITIHVDPNVGTKLDLTKGDDGEYISPFDYIKYRYCLKYKKVCPSEKELPKHQKALFYIYDPDEEKQILASKLALRNEAKLKYLELIQDEDKMEAVISLMTSHKNPINLSLEEKQLIIEQKADAEPEKFLEVINDEDLLMKSFIYKCISAGVFRQSGTRIIFEDNILGEDIDSSVKFLKSKEGSKYYVSAEGRLNEWINS